MFTRTLKYYGNKTLQILRAQRKQLEMAAQIFKQLITYSLGVAYMQWA